MDLMVFDLALDASTILFVLSLIGGTLLLALALASKAFRTFEFFPPPSKKSWQSLAFIGLFRLFVYPLIALSILKYEHPNDWNQIVLGAAFLVLGFGTAILITFQMGWRNAFGERRGLQTSGWFRLSRNPVYVATWIGLVGWVIIIPVMQVAILLALWGLMYLLAPLVEEPWLEREYGSEYLAYRRRTRRFL